MLYAMRRKAYTPSIMSVCCRLEAAKPIVSSSGASITSEGIFCSTILDAAGVT